jgi:tetratricopeptide (TPR) repeat protein
MANRIKKYNPAFLSSEELVRTFVVRHTELEMIMRVIKENVTKSNQHILVIGPRGIGKTMLVLRVVEKIREEGDLRERWYPLVFGEESYQVSSPGEFWLEALFHLAHKTGDEQLGQTYEELGEEPDDERLSGRAIAQLMDFADAVGKRILLVVENFNMLLGEQISDSDAWKLRYTLLHEPRIMLLATATRRFEEIENYGKPMFELFKMLELKPLDDKECGALWASISQKKANDERVRPLQILTGGNPRLLAIISTFAARMSLRELMDDLMQLVDDNTEYFKSHLDSLPAIERKVYLALAELWDPVPARNVAKAARLGVSQASALLRRLIERGMVLEANGERRKKLYKVAERMYNIYYLMRRRGAPSRRIKALVRFMVPFYAPKELVSLTKRIAEEACELRPELRREHFWAYEGLLEYTSTQSLRDKLIKAPPQDFFEMPDVPASVKKLVEHEKTKDLREAEADEDLLKLLEKADGLEKTGKFEEAERVYRKAIEKNRENAVPWAKLGALLHTRFGRYEEAVKVCRKAIELDPEYVTAWVDLGCLFRFHLKHWKEAKQTARRIVDLRPESGFGWTLFGDVHKESGRYEEAEEAYRKATELDEEYMWGWASFGLLLHEKLERYDEAEKAYRKAIKIDNKNVWAWTHLGQLLHEKIERYDEAEKAYRKAIKIDNKNVWAWAHLGQLLHEKLERYDEAEKAYRKGIKIDNKNEWIWAHLGQLLHEKLERYDEAEKAYRKALEIDNKFAWAWAYLGELLHETLERYDEAETAYRKSIEIDDKNAWAWANLGQLLHEKLERHDEAEKAYRKAIELEPEVAWGYAKLGQLLHEKLERYDEAEKAYRKVLELEPKKYSALISLITMLLDKMGQTSTAVRLAKEYVAKDPKEVGLLNALAWTFCKYGPQSFLVQEEEWAREAISVDPEDGNYQYTLGSILCKLGKEREALQNARKYAEDEELVEKTVEDAIDLFIELAASGVGQEALKILQESPSAKILEPLVVGLQLFVDEDVKAAAEIMEVARDVVKRIEQRRDKMQSKTRMKRQDK